MISEVRLPSLGRITRTAPEKQRVEVMDHPDRIHRLVDVLHRRADQGLLAAAPLT